MYLMKVPRCIAEIAKSAEGLNKLTDNLGVIIKKFILEN